MATDVGRTGFHVRCTAHVVNLAVKAEFSKIEKSIDSQRNIVRTFRVFVRRRE